MIGFLIQGEGLEMELIMRPFHKASYTTGRPPPTNVMRKLRMRGRFYEFGWDGPEDDPSGVLSELVRTDGNAYVDIYFHDDMKAIGEEYPAGSYCFLNETSSALEVSVNYPAHYLDWFNDIVLQCDGADRFFTLSCISQTEKGAEPAQNVKDAAGRAHDDTLAWVHLSAGNLRLDRIRPL